MNQWGRRNHNVDVKEMRIGEKNISQSLVLK